jgi:hypothetical protein
MKYCGSIRKISALLGVSALLLSLPLKAQLLDGEQTPDDSQLRLNTPTSSAQPNGAAQPRNNTQRTPSTATQSQPVERGSAYQIKNSVKPTETKAEKKSYIFLYMEDFKVTRDLQKDVRCTMKFYVWPTDHAIKEISYRLKWEGMETPVSFNNVQPNQPTYFSYALLGKGCYNMDKAPNIIVNRCRIKDMSQQRCASMINWVN